MNIVYASSDLFAPHTGISILSLFENNQQEEQIKVHILDCGISEQNKQKIQSVAVWYGRDVSFLDRQNEYDYLISTCGIKAHYGSFASCARAFADMVFPDVDKLLLLGSDTIVLQPLKELYELDMEQFVLAGVAHPEFYNGHIYEDPEILELNKQYLNTDVVIFNMKLWKENNYTKKIIEAYQKKTFLLSEQSVMAYVVYENIKVIPLKYNYWGHRYSKSVRNRVLGDGIAGVSRAEIEEAHNNPVIVHYLGRTDRPWVKGANGDKKHKAYYYKYKSMSPWAELSMESVYDLHIFNHKIPCEKFVLFLYLKFHKYAPYRLNQWVTLKVIPALSKLKNKIRV